MRRRVGGAHKLLSTQQAIADHLAAGLEPVALCERVLATLGRVARLDRGRGLAPRRLAPDLRHRLARGRRPRRRRRA